MMDRDIIDVDEMNAMNETFDCSCKLQRTSNSEVYKSFENLSKNDIETNSIKKVESLIKNFLLLSKADKHNVSYIIELLETSNEKEKRTILQSLGLKYCT